MLNFFRRIRQKHLAKNKMGNYFKYAIGEIVLVMIGILLALQVNNWNENRKNKAIEQVYLNRLFNDLKKDHETLLFSMGNAKARTKQINQLTEAIKTPDSLFSNPGLIIESIEKVTWRSYLPLSRIVYDELRSSGNMAILESDKLREQLASYYAFAEHWESILKSLEYQKEFSKETAGLLDMETLEIIENTSTVAMSNSKNNHDYSLQPTEVNQIISTLAQNQNATKWLPQINHYHVLSKRIIEQLISQNDELMREIRVQTNLKDD